MGSVPLLRGHPLPGSLYTCRIQQQHTHLEECTFIHLIDVALVLHGHATSVHNIVLAATTVEGETVIDRADTLYTRTCA